MALNLEGKGTYKDSKLKEKLGYKGTESLEEVLRDAEDRGKNINKALGYGNKYSWTIYKGDLYIPLQYGIKEALKDKDFYPNTYLSWRKENRDKLQVDISLDQYFKMLEEKKEEQELSIKGKTYRNQHEFIKSNPKYKNYAGYKREYYKRTGKELSIEDYIKYVDTNYYKYRGKEYPSMSKIVEQFGKQLKAFNVYLKSEYNDTDVKGVKDIEKGVDVDNYIDSYLRYEVVTKVSSWSDEVNIKFNGKEYKTVLEFFQTRKLRVQDYKKWMVKTNKEIKDGKGLIEYLKYLEDEGLIRLEESKGKILIRRVVQGEREKRDRSKFQYKGKFYEDVASCLKENGITEDDIYEVSGERVSDLSRSKLNSVITKVLSKKEREKTQKYYKYQGKKYKTKKELVEGLGGSVGQLFHWETINNKKVTYENVKEFGDYIVEHLKYVYNVDGVLVDITKYLKSLGLDYSIYKEWVEYNGLDIDTVSLKDQKYMESFKVYYESNKDKPKEEKVTKIKFLGKEYTSKIELCKALGLTEYEAKLVPLKVPFELESIINYVEKCVKNRYNKNK